jgi:hypothetical protein
MNNNYCLKLSILFGYLLASCPLASAQTSSFEMPQTKLEILASYSDLLAIQSVLDSGVEFDLFESKGFPDGFKLFPVNDRVYMDEVLKSIFESAENYKAYYFSDDSCPGRNSTVDSPFVGVDIFKYTTAFLNSSVKEITLQVTAFKSWYENGECHMTPAITSVTWRSR